VETGSSTSWNETLGRGIAGVADASRAIFREFEMLGLLKNLALSFVPIGKEKRERACGGGKGEWSLTKRFTIALQ